jgi:hypothetical protein
MVAHVPPIRGRMNTMKKETAPAPASMPICRLEALMLAGAQLMARDEKVRREVAQRLS